MKAYLPWRIFTKLEDWLTPDYNRILYILIENPYKVSSKIKEWILQNYSKYIKVDKEGYIDDYADTYIDVLAQKLPNNPKLTRLDKGQLDTNKYIEVEIENPDEFFEQGILILDNLDEISAFLDQQDYVRDISGANLKRFFRSPRKKSSMDDIDSEINNELIQINFKKFNPYLTGLILLYFTNMSLFKLMDLTEQVCLSKGIYWKNYTDFSALINQLNKEFKFNPPIEDFNDLMNYVETDNGYQVQLKKQAESLCRLTVRLHKILEGMKVTK